MLLSALIPLAGVPVENAIGALEDQARRLASLHGQSADDRLTSYHEWAPQASLALGYVFALDDVERLIATHRHDALVARATAYNQALINHTISAEQTDRARVFDATVAELRQLERHCLAMPQTVLVADTNVFLHHDRYFDEIDWNRIAGHQEGRVRLLIPMAVVRELDKSKRAPGNKFVSDTNSELVRTRARVSCRRLRERFPDVRAPISLGEGTQAELLLDPVGHVRLADPDSEIIDRAVAAQTLSGRSVSIVTGDGNMRFSAQVAGLMVAPVSNPED